MSNLPVTKGEIDSEQQKAAKEENTPIKNAPDNPVKSVAKDSPVLLRLKKSGLDPQKLLDVTLPNGKVGSSVKKRHVVIRLAFVLVVLLPTLFVSGYMFFIASNQFESTAAFAIRSSSSAAATEVLGMVLDSGGGESTTSNSYIVHDYLQSQTFVEDLKTELDLNEIFNAPGSDWFFRMGNDLAIEDVLDYWNSMSTVSYDSTSGVLYVRVRSFSAEHSMLLADAALRWSERLINKLSNENRRESVRYAQEAVARAEARIRVIRSQLVEYREQTQEVSPEENARIAAEMIAALDQTMAAKQAEKRTLQSYLDENSPRIRLLTQEIIAIGQQIENERKRVGSGSSSTESGAASGESISFRIADYTDLKLEEEFAHQLYTTALASLEQARQDADQKHMYLATFIKPTLSEEAQYPSRTLISIASFFVLFGAWITGVLMYYNIRDRN